MDAGQQEKLEREQLERARARLTQEQRDYLDRLCNVHLRDQDIYAPKHEIALADILYEGRSPLHQRGQIKGVVTRAHNEASNREAEEQHAANLKAYKESDVQLGQPAQQLPPNSPPQASAGATKVQANDNAGRSEGLVADFVTADTKAKATLDQAKQYSRVLTGRGL